MAEVESRAQFPVNILWDKILMLAIFGVLDSARSQDVMEAVLNKIIATKSKVIIIDIVGVATVDSAVANHLIKITKATKLVGAESIISGLSAEIAQTLVNLGIDLGQVVTTGTLADALSLAYEKTGFAVRKID